MLNNVVLVGRITNDIEKIENEENTSYRLMLKISRSFKNENGEYETDIVPIELMSYIGSNVLQYCEKGDIIGAKGRIQNNENGISVIAERITFLSNNKKLANQN